MFNGTYTSDDDDSGLTTEKLEETMKLMAKLVDEKINSEFADIFSPRHPSPKIEMNTARYDGLYPNRSFMMRPIVAPEINIIESEFCTREVTKCRPRKKGFWEKFWASLSHWPYCGCEFYTVTEPIIIAAGRNTIYCHPSLAAEVQARK